MRNSYCRCFAACNSTFKRLSARPASSWSYVSGPSAVPLKNVTIGQLLEEKTELHPSRNMFVFSQSNTVKSYEQFYHESRRLAAGLLKLGLSPGDRVGIWAPNCYEWVLTQFAAAFGGFILVNINPAYQPRELEFCLQKVGVRALIAAHSFKSQSYYELLFQLCPELASCGPGALHSSRGTWSFSEIAGDGTSERQQRLDELRSRIQADDACNIQFTSGTTGSPKGATLTHHGIVNNAYFTGLRCGYQQLLPRLCCPSPLYHAIGNILAVLCVLAHSGSCVFPSRLFDALETLRAVDSEKCNALIGTPTMFIDILNHPRFDQFDVSSLQTGFMAGAPCPTEVCRQMISRLNMHKFTVGYGTTENSPVTFQCASDDDEHARTQTVGRVHEHQEAKVVDENGLVVPCGSAGELWTRGYMVMLEYWDDPHKTAQVIRHDRWYRTGDIAVLDERGYCQIVGRIKDMIIRGGENIYPTEIEQLLHSHPKIEDAYVVGVPDARLGEEICAWVRLHHGQTASAQDIQQFCRENLARFKTPRYVLFKSLAEFPVTVTGKVQKFKMREQSKRELQLEHVVPHLAAAE